jgi:hypothetical protein
MGGSTIPLSVHPSSITTIVSGASLHRRDVKTGAGAGAGENDATGELIGTAARSPRLATAGLASTAGRNEKAPPAPKSRLLSSRSNFPATDQHVLALLRRRALGPSFKDLMDRSSGSGCGTVNDYRFTVGPRLPGQAATWLAPL